MPRRWRRWCEQVMREAGLPFGDLDRIAVTTGPGTFTGVRIGLAMARGLGPGARAFRSSASIR